MLYKRNETILEWQNKDRTENKCSVANLLSSIEPEGWSDHLKWHINSKINVSLETNCTKLKLDIKKEILT